MGGAHPCRAPPPLSIALALVRVLPTHSRACCIRACAPLDYLPLIGSQMDAFAQTLFYVAVTMGLLMVWMAWRHFLWADSFFMQMWAFGFPTVALAWAGVLYDATIDTALRHAPAQPCPPPLSPRMRPCACARVRAALMRACQSPLHTLPSPQPHQPVPPPAPTPHPPTLAARCWLSAWWWWPACLPSRSCFARWRESAASKFSSQSTSGGPCPTSPSPRCALRTGLGWGGRLHWAGGRGVSHARTRTPAHARAHSHAHSRARTLTLAGRAARAAHQAARHRRRARRQPLQRAAAGARARRVARLQDCEHPLHQAQGGGWLVGACWGVVACVRKWDGGGVARAPSRATPPSPSRPSPPSPSPQDAICFPQIGAYFPGHQTTALAQNKKLLELQAGVDALFTSLGGLPASAAAAAGGKDGAGAAAAAAVAAGLADTTATLDAAEGTSLADKLAAATAANQARARARGVAPSRPTRASRLALIALPPCSPCLPASHPPPTHPHTPMLTLTRVSASLVPQVLVVGRSTCPFCIEVTRTLADMGLRFPYLQGARVCVWVRACVGWGGAACACIAPQHQRMGLRFPLPPGFEDEGSCAACLFVHGCGLSHPTHRPSLASSPHSQRLPVCPPPSPPPSPSTVDKMPEGAQLHEALKSTTGQRTVVSSARALCVGVGRGRHSAARWQPPLFTTRPPTHPPTPCARPRSPTSILAARSSAAATPQRPSSPLASLTSSSAPLLPPPPPLPPPPRAPTARASPARPAARLPVAWGRWSRRWRGCLRMRC